MKLKKLMRALALLLVLCCTVGFAGSALAPAAVLADNQKKEDDRITQGDIDKLQDRLDQLAKEQERLTRELEEAKANSAQKAVLIQSYEALITNYKKDIQATEEIITAYEGLIELKSTELSQKQAEYSRMLLSYKDKLRFTHESGIYTTLQMVFSAESFSEFLTSSIRFGDILDHTNTIMEKLEACAVEIEGMLAELNTAKAQMDVYVTTLKNDKAYAERLLAEAEEEKKQLDDDAAATEALINYYKSLQEQADRELTQMLKDYQSQIERDEADKEAAKLLWPLDKRNVYVTSTFGGRIHPVYKEPMNHSGVDLAGPYSGSIAGDPIYAMQSGLVIIAGWGSGYGNYVVIDHGNDVTSVYAHCTKLLVEKGDTVERGDKVGTVGMTGTATGYHLHFEIRINGEKQDPLDYSYIFKKGEEPVSAEKFVKYR